jgi:creatinine amidohydrolase
MKGSSVKKSRVLDMTWEAFRDAVDEKTVMVIPMGSTELEGPHLPLGVDTFVADGVAEGLCGEPGVLIGPTLPFGYSKWFTPFPGTVSLDQGTLSRVLSEYCDCMMKHGIRRIVFLNAHRGNTPCIDNAARSLILDHPVRVGMVSIWKLANDLIQDRNLIEEGKFTHAGELMTSMIMALRPETVVLDKMKADAIRSPEGSEFEVKNSLGDTAFRGSVQTVYPDILEVTDTGVFGDPTGASAEKGNQLLALVTDYVRAYLKEFRELPLEDRRA